MHCNMINQEGIIEGVICGNSGNFSLSDKWCSYPTNNRQSYWSIGRTSEDPNCYSVGTCIDLDIAFDAYT